MIYHSPSFQTYSTHKPITWRGTSVSFRGLTQVIQIRISYSFHMYVLYYFLFCGRIHTPLSVSPWILQIDILREINKSQNFHSWSAKETVHTFLLSLAGVQHNLQLNRFTGLSVSQCADSLSIRLHQAL